MNPYLSFVESVKGGIESAKNQVVSGTTAPVTTGAKALLFSPHPDDECIIGLLALRLTRDAGMRVMNVPMTFGSNPDRQAGRKQELEDACAYLGWEITGGKDDLSSLDADDVVALLTEHQPSVIVCPHAKDWNSRHIATHFLIMEALAKMPADFSCAVVETEYWGAMDDPNLMVEADAEILADLIAATSLHTEEVSRNPYHLLLPAWMQDNVRRGGELVGGQGTAVPDFSFATLYRLSQWADGKMTKPFEGGKYLATGENPAELLAL